ncbi:MAG: hypothetical protein ACYTGH_06905 [Planctomycetota bacterium]
MKTKIARDGSFLLHCSGEPNPVLEPKRGDVIPSERHHHRLRPAEESIRQCLEIAARIDRL